MEATDFYGWLERNHPESLDEGLRDFARNAILGGAVMAGGMGLGGEPSMAQAAQPKAAAVNVMKPGEKILKDGLNQYSDGKTYVYLTDAPEQPAMMRVIEMKAKQAFMRATGSDMRGVQWGQKQTKGKVGVWFKLP